jgi:hypothetical protein
MKIPKQFNKHELQKIEREIKIYVKDTYDNRKQQPKMYDFIKITPKNINEFMELKNMSLNIGYGVALQRKYILSHRELEFLYLFYKLKLNKTINSQNLLFDKLRNEKPQYLKTHQDNRLSHPITETLKELTDNKLIIKENPNNKFSPFILNPEIFLIENTEQIMNSIKELLNPNSKLEIPPLFLKLSNRMNEILKIKNET